MHSLLPLHVPVVAARSAKAHVPQEGLVAQNDPEVLQRAHLRTIDTKPLDPHASNSVSSRVPDHPRANPLQPVGGVTDVAVEDVANSAAVGHVRSGVVALDDLCGTSGQSVS